MNWMMRTRGLPTFFLSLLIIPRLREFINVFEAEVQNLEADQFKLGTPPARCEVIPHGGHSFDRMDFANPTFEQMAQHWFDSFCANPIVASVACSRS
jgi:hypothetical protein